MSHVVIFWFIFGA